MRWMLPAVMVMALSAPADQPKTGQDLVAAMHARYASTWYETLSFVQGVVYADGRPAQDWWEALRIPGRLRIDMPPMDAPSRTVIYRGETRTLFDQGKLTGSSRNPNLLLVLGFDVYRQPPETTVALLQKEGFDLAKLREDSWEGRPAYVVGADAGDTVSSQFWIEKERLLFLRLVQKNKAGVVSDIRFTKYEPLGRAWLATIVQFLSDGKETFREIYRDWRVDPAVTEDQFDVDAWKPPTWVKQK
jgi:hypothetical protein